MIMIMIVIIVMIIINDYEMVPRPLLDMRWTNQSINNQYSLVSNKLHV